MDDFLAAAAAHDAREMAAATGGRATTDAQEFLAWLHEHEARRSLRDADPRSAAQLADEIGELYQRFLDAWWYGTAEQTRRAAEAFARAMEHPSAERLYVHAAAVQVGDYVRAEGYDPFGERDAATGVVDAVEYTERVIDQYGFGEPASQYGFEFTLMPVVRADRRAAAEPADVWVVETGSRDVLRLRTPVDRGAQAWLHAPTPVVAGADPARLSHSNFADEPGPAPDGSASPARAEAEAEPEAEVRRRHARRYR